MFCCYFFHRGAEKSMLKHLNCSKVIHPAANWPFSLALKTHSSFETVKVQNSETECPRGTLTFKKPTEVS